MLRSGDVLLGVAMNDMPHPDLHVETVGHAELVCLMPEGHRLAGHAQIGFAELAEETLISYRVDTLPGRLLAGALEAEGGVYAPAVEIDLSITALPFVREGIGVAVVDGLLPWSQFSGIVQRPFRPGIRVPIAILTSKERPLSGSHDLMRECLRRAARALEPGGN
ncbi:LysR substrate-binding domain-containing protein [Azospirillum sp. INR13]|uniref:LysR substrate-binding domain-containing protein n=1 Tax=Azospirillum sp. INR13 TaxID=2596919 RepID=UPI0021073AAF|nr:LysR substrate-binding domain-containing protein [Azospirillum sp. INR13]